MVCFPYSAPLDSFVNETLTVITRGLNCNRFSIPHTSVCVYCYCEWRNAVRGAGANLSPCWEGRETVNKHVGCKTLGHGEQACRVQDPKPKTTALRSRDRIRTYESTHVAYRIRVLFALRLWLHCVWLDQGKLMCSATVSLQGGICWSNDPYFSHCTQVWQEVSQLKVLCKL